MTVLRPHRSYARMKVAGYYTSGQVATLCACAPRTVSKWIDSGKLRGHRLPGSLDRRVHHDDLVAFLRTAGCERQLADLIGGQVDVLLVGVGGAFAEALSARLGSPVASVPCAGSAGAYVVRHRPRVVVLVLSVLGVAAGRTLAHYLGTVDEPPAVLLLYPEDVQGEPGCLQEPIDPAVLATALQGLLPSPRQGGV